MTILRLCVLFAGLFSLLLPSPSEAGSSTSDQHIPASLSVGINHLLSLVGKETNGAFDPTKATDLINFIASGKDANTRYYPDDIDNTTAVYHQFETHSDLSRLLDYAYNPAIPAQAMSPSSLRTARLLPGPDGRLPSWQWHRTDDLTEPQVIHMAEHEEITPDLNTGAYYGYDVDRTMILFRHQGRRIFLSLSRQRDTSEVGRKGLTLGTTDDWDFLYSKEQGLTMGGLGWVKSYMYRSFSISVFMETEGGTPGLRCGIFKWLNAGWAGINMVKREHIHRGIDRYAADLTRILENRQLPPPTTLANGFAALKKISGDEQKRLLVDYLKLLTAKYRTSGELSRKSFADLLVNARYLETLNTGQMRAILELEYLKTVLGKPATLPRLATLVTG